MTTYYHESILNGVFFSCLAQGLLYYIASVDDTLSSVTVHTESVATPNYQQLSIKNADYLKVSDFGKDYI